MSSCDIPSVLSESESDIDTDDSKMKINEEKQQKEQKYKMKLQVYYNNIFQNLIECLKQLQDKKRAIEFIIGNNHSSCLDGGHENNNHLLQMLRNLQDTK